MAKLFWVSGALTGALAVILGAFGAHGLRGRLSEDLMRAYQTGVEYQWFHVLALLVIGLLVQQFPGSAMMRWAGYGFLLGMLLFCGSLYLLALTGQSWLGPITPLGGVVWIVSWILLAMALWKVEL